MGLYYLQTASVRVRQSLGELSENHDVETTSLANALLEMSI